MTLLFVIIAYDFGELTIFCCWDIVLIVGQRFLVLYALCNKDRIFCFEGLTVNIQCSCKGMIFCCIPCHIDRVFEVGILK